MSDEEKVHYIEQVVGIDQLHHQTMMGWEVIERVEFDEPISYQDHHVAPGQSYPTSYTRTQVGRAVGFRCRLAVNSPVAALTEQVRALESQQQVDRQEKETAKGALAAEQKAHNATKADLKRAHEYSELQRKDKDKIEAIKSQLEADIGKLREYLGRKVFEEILPPPPPKTAEQ